uniref:Uncharacterized protein n=1 Tax=Anguilla anguilla TaxID=7936 RepID=A0A0E9SIN7_ANGAN
MWLSMQLHLHSLRIGIAWCYSLLSFLVNMPFINKYFHFKLMELLTMLKYLAVMLHTVFCMKRDSSVLS